MIDGAPGASRRWLRGAGDFLDGLVVMGDVVGALFVREVRTRYAGKSLGFFWAFAQPLSWVVFFALMYWLLDRRPPILTDNISFLATAFITFFLFRMSMRTVIGATRRNRALLYYSQVRPFDFMLARAGVEFFTYAVVMVSVILANYLIFDEYEMTEPLGVIGFFGIAWLLGFSIGVFVEGMSRFAPQTPQFFDLAMRPLFWISALFYTAKELPGVALDVLTWNPVLHVVEGVRDAAFLHYRSPAADPLYPLSIAVVALFVGLSLERYARRNPDLA